MTGPELRKLREHLGEALGREAVAGHPQAGEVRLPAHRWVKDRQHRDVADGFVVEEGGPGRERALPRDEVLRGHRQRLAVRVPRGRLLLDEDRAESGEVGVGAGADDEGHGPILRHAGPMVFDGPWIQLFIDVPREGWERSVDFWAA